jgi:hypothetical protein
MRAEAALSTVVLMPEAAMYKYHFTPRSEDDVGTPGKIGRM